MSAPVILTKKSILKTHCSVCGRATEHVYNPSEKKPLACLICYPEKDPRKEGEK
jgi:CxxC-x17-CxxC domain-containing protein